MADGEKRPSQPQRLVKNPTKLWRIAPYASACLLGGHWRLTILTRARRLEGSTHMKFAVGSAPNPWFPAEVEIVPPRVAIRPSALILLQRLKRPALFRRDHEIAALYGKWLSALMFDRVGHARRYLWHCRPHERARAFSVAGPTTAAACRDPDGSPQPILALLPPLVGSGVKRGWR
jgi:hypothetical protein